MPLLKVPHLSRNRHDAFFFRLRSGLLDQRVSLCTKDPVAPHVAVACASRRKTNQAPKSQRHAQGFEWPVAQKSPQNGRLEVHQ